MDLETLAIRFSTQGEAQVRTALQGISDDTGFLHSKMTQLLGVLGSVAFWEQTITKSVELATSLTVLSQKTGESVENLSKLQYAANLSHVSTESLDVGLKFLARSMQQATLGTGPGAAAFRALGISTKDATGQTRSMGDVIGDVAEKFSGMKDGANKMALALDLLGRNGAAWIPFLNQGRGGIKAFTDEADRLGAKLTGVQANQLVQFGEEMKRFHAVIDAVERSLALALIPALENLGTALFGASKGANEFESIAKEVGKVAAWLSNVIIELSLALQG